MESGGGYDIHYQTYMGWLNPNQASAYQVRIKFRYAVYDATLGINDGNGHNLNAALTGYNSNLLTTGNSGYQHYMHYVLKEWIPTS